MKKIIIICAVFLQLFILSCEKNYTEFYRDNRPEVPVTFEGATTHGFNPFIEVPLTDGRISFTLAIPESSGRTIAAISRVNGGATAINAGAVRAATYIANPIPGNGTRATFSTTIDEFRAYTANNNTLVEDFIRGNARQLEIAFMFLITLDNGQEIIPVQARVFINK